VGANQQMNEGKYLHRKRQEMLSHTDFCIAYLAIPEKHFEAPSMRFDLEIT